MGVGSAAWIRSVIRLSNYPSVCGLRGPHRLLDVDGVAQPYFQQLFWAGLITVAYLPSTVFPTGPSSEGLPIGLQAVSGEYEDRTCIEFARLIRDEIGGFVPPPGY